MNKTQRCDGVTRRDLIRIGGLSALGLGLGDFFRLQKARAADSSLQPKAKSCILIWLDGGPSHLETFDPKPDAPEEVRGPLETIGTNVTGVRIGECLEQTAQIMDKLAVIRSMTSPLGEHTFGTHYLMTGYKPSPALEYPTFGATLTHVRKQSGVLPPHIAVPKFSGNVSGNGFLPGATQPFSVGGNPDRPNFKVRDLDFYRGLDLTRLDRRRQIVNAFDEFSRAKDASAFSRSDPDLERAYNLIASPAAKNAFKLSDEPESVRNRYGRTGGNSIGQSCLLARRLVERGVPFVTVNSGGWDNELLELFNVPSAILPEVVPSSRVVAPVIGMVVVVLIHAMVTQSRRKVTGFVVGIKRRGIRADTQPVIDNSLIRIMCPNLSCQRILVVPEGARGKVVRCSMCGMNVRIPVSKKADPVAPKKGAVAPKEDGATTESA